MVAVDRIAASLSFSMDDKAIGIDVETGTFAKRYSEPHSPIFSPFPDDSLALPVLACYRTPSWEGFDRKSEFISSPNVDWCPMIEDTAHGIYLRADGMFGGDDPTSWPKLYSSRAPHLPCIPLCDPDPASAVHIFRRGLIREQVRFQDLTGSLMPVGTVFPYLITQIKLTTALLVDRVGQFLSKTSEPHSRLKKLLQFHCGAVEKLAERRDTLHDLRITFGVAARTCFEIHGYLDYYTIYQPRISSTDVYPVNKNLVGVLVKAKGTCDVYLKMGVPVWYIRDESSAPGLPVCGPKFVKPTLHRDRICHPGCFRDDGYFRDYDPIFPECPADTRNLLMVFDIWTVTVLG